RAGRLRPVDDRDDDERDAREHREDDPGARAHAPGPNTCGRLEQATICRVRSVKGRVARLGLLITAAFVALLCAAPAAFAADGVGIGGPADDRKVTYWAFGVMVFFALFVIVGAAIQSRLEGRKERVRRELERVRHPDA